MAAWWRSGTGGEATSLAMNECSGTLKYEHVYRAIIGDGNVLAVEVNCFPRTGVYGILCELISWSGSHGPLWTGGAQASGRFGCWSRSSRVTPPMYAVYSMPESIISYLDAFRTTGLPLVIGEFGHEFPAGTQTRMAQAQQRGLGYIGWSWSGNTDGALDMTVGFDPANLTAWGERFLNGTNGVRQTSREAELDRQRRGDRLPWLPKSEAGHDHHDHSAEDGGGGSPRTPRMVVPPPRTGGRRPMAIFG